MAGLIACEWPAGSRPAPEGGEMGEGARVLAGDPPLLSRAAHGQEVTHLTRLGARRGRQEPPGDGAVYHLQDLEPAAASGILQDDHALGEFPGAGAEGQARLDDGLAEDPLHGQAVEDGLELLASADHEAPSCPVQARLVVGDPEVGSLAAALDEVDDAAQAK